MKATKHGPVFVVLVAILLVTLTIIATAKILPFWKDRKKAELRAKIIRTIDPRKIQLWAIPILAEHERSYEIPRETWPPFLQTSDGPDSARIAVWASGKRAVMISWGSGFGNRVLIVGDESLVLTEEYLGFPVEPWAAGVYFALDPRR